MYYTVLDYMEKPERLPCRIFSGEMQQECSNSASKRQYVQKVSRTMLLYSILVVVKSDFISLSLFAFCDCLHMFCRHNHCCVFQFHVLHISLLKNLMESLDWYLTETMCQRWWIKLCLNSQWDDPKALEKWLQVKCLWLFYFCEQAERTSPCLRLNSTGDGWRIFVKLFVVGFNCSFWKAA